MQSTRHILAATAALAVIATSQAQSPIVYNAARGSLPDAQCFTSVTTNGAPVLIESGELHVGPSAPLGVTYFGRQDFSFDFDSGFWTEATFRVVHSDCNVNGSGHVRYGIQLSAADDNGNFCAAHFCDTYIALVTTPNSGFDGVNAIRATYPVAGNTITALLVADATACHLYIDGNLLLSVPRGTYVSPMRELYFGNGTNAAGAEYLVSYVRAAGTSDACTPTSVTTIESGCAGLGPLTFSGITQPGQPATVAFSIPGPQANNVPILFVGAYAMQPAYCTQGCRFGLDTFSAIAVADPAVMISLPAMSAFVGWPIAFQGARIGLPGACSNPIVHSLTDISVMTL